jgi:hypothetical protein
VGTVARELFRRASPDIDATPAIGREAVAGYGRTGGAKTVIDRQFLAGADPASAEEENAAADFAGDEIWVATVIDPFRAGAANPSINAPIPIQTKQEAGQAAAALCKGAYTLLHFAPRETRAGILDYLAPGRDGLPSEHAESLDGRPANTEVKWRSPMGHKGNALLGTLRE